MVPRTGVTHEAANDTAGPANGGNGEANLNQQSGQAPVSWYVHRD